MAVAILVAAGSGERLGAGRPKAFVALAGRPMIEWSVRALRAAGLEAIVVALPAGHPAPPGCTGVSGGRSRSQSVASALAAAPADDRVVVHDAARPLVPPELFRATLAALADADAATAAARVTDTVKEAGPDGYVVAHARPHAAVGGADAAGLPPRVRSSGRSPPRRRCSRGPPTTPCSSSASAGACAS